MTEKQILDISIDVGIGMLIHGAEIHRVEDTISRISSAYGCKADVFAIPASLIVTLSNSTGETYTKTCRITKSDINLNKVDLLNSLARKICASLPTLEEIQTELNAIENTKSYNQITNILAAALAAAAFSLFFGGGIHELISAAIFGAVIRGTNQLVAKFGSGYMLSYIVGGILCALLPLLTNLYFISLQTDVVITSTLMLLVPGLTLTSSMREFIAGDLVTGVMKITEALIIAAGVAIGVIVVLVFVAGGSI